MVYGPPNTGQCPAVPASDSVNALEGSCGNTHQPMQEINEPFHNHHVNPNMVQKKCTSKTLRATAHRLSNRKWKGVKGYMLHSTPLFTTAYALKQILKFMIGSFNWQTSNIQSRIFHICHCLDFNFIINCQIYSKS